ncbi:DUF2764 family protein [Roseiconus nitratireducens]|uniref:DUF2764 family protein n=1 Tax=Roseiconus nitratireducens TaxID=2605748 RepID=A0A5M6CWV2_9BACT|nr:DUF2764 family protein [Roseiconus nitratireducens]KAA5539708.1 DUF2764 family protein [Roseiconus nitratireducens]
MTSYYTLVASLPPLPQPFDSGPLPITRSTLRSRLDLLDDDDRMVVDQISRFFVWDRQPLDRTDEEVWQTHQRLMEQIDNPLVRQVVNHRFDMRTIVAAIRRKRDQEGPPIGVPPLAGMIRRNWDAPDFNLSTRYRWIGPFAEAAAAGKVVQAQHILFTDLWNTWTRIAQQYHFTFESILLYLARWEIVERWTSRDADAGRERFNDLIRETLGEYAELD